MTAIIGPNEIRFDVLDTGALDFTDAARGYKSSETLVRIAEGGERIETKDSAGNVESTYETKAGDIIFVNLHNPDDIYVPRNKQNKAWDMAELKRRGYEITGEDQENGGLRVVNKAEFSVLLGMIDRPMCIPNAWGPGNHQFLYEGAALKQDLDGGKVSGISKEAFEQTWTLTKEQGPQPHKSAPKVTSTTADTVAGDRDQQTVQKRSGSGVPLISRK